MAKLSKRMKAISESFDASKIYEIAEAVKIVKENAKAKFDESIDIALTLNVDTKQSDQVVRGAVSLPNGTGKTFRVIAFAKGPKAEEAKKDDTKASRYAFVQRYITVFSVPADKINVCLIENAVIKYDNRIDFEEAIARILG